MSDTETESLKSTNEGGKQFCALCRTNVKRYVECYKCNKNYHPSCALRIIGLYVLDEGVLCCNEKLDTGPRSAKSSSNLPTTSAISPLEFELTNKLLSELKDKNMLLKQNKILLEEKLVTLQTELNNLKIEEFGTVKSMSSYADALKNSNVNSLILKPKNKQNHSDTRDAVREIMPSSKLAELEVGVRTVKNINGGGIIIDCNSATSRETIKERVTKFMNKKYDIRDGKLIYPKIVIKGIEENILDESDETIINLVLKQNQLDVELNHLKVIRKFKTGKNKNVRNLILEVNPHDFQHLMSLKKLKIGRHNCALFEHLDIFRCFQCNVFQIIVEEHQIAADVLETTKRKNVRVKNENV